MQAASTFFRRQKVLALAMNLGIIYKFMCG